MTLLTTLFEHRTDEFAADGSILVAESGRVNLVPNPCAVTNVDGWVDLSNTGVERVTSIAGVTTIPSGTAIHVPADNDGTYAETDLADMPLGDLASGDFLSVQAQVYISDVAVGDVELVVEVGFYDADDVSNYVTAVQEAYLPIAGFGRFAANIAIPDPIGGQAALERCTVWVHVDNDAVDGADDAELYLTQVSLQEADSLSAVIPSFGALANLTLVTEAAASGTIALSGTAWLTPRAHGSDTFSASGRIELRGTSVRLSAFTSSAIATSSEAAATVITTTAPHGMGTSGTALVTISGHTSTPSLNGTHTATLTGASTFTIPVTVTTAGTGGAADFPDSSSGASLPATDGDGWTTPDVTPPDIQGLTVVVGGITIDVAQIADLTIELDVEGGPKSATMSVNCPLDRAPRVGRDTLLVTYKTKVLFRGRLENMTGQVDSSTGYTLTYAGPLVTLRDHKAFRTVYVDSDLDSWRIDQGPQTSPDTFEGIAAGVW